MLNSQKKRLGKLFMFGIANEIVDLYNNAKIKVATHLLQPLFHIQKLAGRALSEHGYICTYTCYMYV